MSQSRFQIFNALSHQDISLLVLRGDVHWLEKLVDIGKLLQPGKLLLMQATGVGTQNGFRKKSRWLQRPLALSNEK